MVYRFVFDVDGTLTPSRQKINSKFHDWFLNFTNENYVYLVTGSDYPKTVEQLGKKLCENVERVYNCSGSDVWEKGKTRRTRGIHQAPARPHQPWRQLADLRPREPRSGRQDRRGRAR